MKLTHTELSLRSSKSTRRGTARLESNRLPKNPKTELKSGYCVEIRDQSDYTALYTFPRRGLKETNSNRVISQIIEEYASRDRRLESNRLPKNPKTELNSGYCV